MESTLIIPAGGEQTRWQSSYPKQLVTVNGESLIARAIRQFDRHIDVTVILSDNPAITTPFGYGSYMPRGHRCLCEALVESRHLWGHRTIILLGDVVLSDATAERLIYDKRPCAFWGNWSDILAVTVYETEANSLMLSMWAAARDMQLNDTRGKLWEAYRAYCGFEFTEHIIDNHGIFVDTMDWSRDFDTVEEYESFLELIKIGKVKL